MTNSHASVIVGGMEDRKRCISLRVNVLSLPGADIAESCQRLRVGGGGAKHRFEIARGSVALLQRIICPAAIDEDLQFARRSFEGLRVRLDCGRCASEIEEKRAEVCQHTCVGLRRL